MPFLIIQMKSKLHQHFEADDIRWQMYSRSFSDKSFKFPAIFCSVVNKNPFLLVVIFCNAIGPFEAFLWAWWKVEAFHCASINQERQREIVIFLVQQHPERNSQEETQPLVAGINYVLWDDWARIKFPVVWMVSVNIIWWEIPKIKEQVISGRICIAQYHRERFPACVWLLLPHRSCHRRHVQRTKKLKSTWNLLGNVGRLYDRGNIVVVIRFDNWRGNANLQKHSYHISITLQTFSKNMFIKPAVLEYFGAWNNKTRRRTCWPVPSPEKVLTSWQFP